MSCLCPITVATADTKPLSAAPAEMKARVLEALRKMDKTKTDSVDWLSGTRLFVLVRYSAVCGDRGVPKDTHVIVVEASYVPRTANHLRYYASQTDLEEARKTYGY